MSCQRTRAKIDGKISYTVTVLRVLPDFPVMEVALDAPHASVLPENADMRTLL
jgi:hypothetical protein